MCSQQLLTLHWMIYWYIKKLLSRMSFLFKNYSLVEVVYLSIRCNKFNFFLWNTSDTDRNGVNKKITPTNTQKKITLEWGSPTVNLDASEFLFFDSAKESSNEVTAFLNLRFITKQKLVFFEKIWHANELQVKMVSLNVSEF